VRQAVASQGAGPRDPLIGIGARLLQVGDVDIAVGDRPTGRSPTGGAAPNAPALPRTLASAAVVGAFLAATFTSSPLVMAVCVTVLDAASLVWNVGSRVLRQTLVPDALLGRVTATMALVDLVAAPIGGLLGGLVAEVAGVRAVGGVAITANVVALALLAPVTTPVDPRTTSAGVNTRSPILRIFGAIWSRSVVLPRLRCAAPRSIRAGSGRRRQQAQGGHRRHVASPVAEHPSTSSMALTIGGVRSEGR
jgi:hypothetical protein